MKTIICAVLLLISAAGTSQTPLTRHADIMKWIMEKATIYGAFRNDYFKEVYEIQSDAFVQTELRKDLLIPNGLVSYYGSYDQQNNRQGNLTYFQLTDIICVEKASLYDKKAITLHLNSPQIITIITVAGKTDTIRQQYVNAAHYKIRLVLQWRSERRLFKKMFRNLLELAEINKRTYQYVYEHRTTEEDITYR